MQHCSPNAATSANLSWRTYVRRYER